MQKQILRDSFIGYLPIEILRTRKEAFSDGVSEHTGDIKTNWIDSINFYCENKYSDDIFLEKSNLFQYNKPHTKEQLFYRDTFRYLFNHYYDNNCYLTVNYWKPNWTGNKYSDPSARKHII